jgi:hypothetical protein
MLQNTTVWYILSVVRFQYCVTPFVSKEERVSFLSLVVKTVLILVMLFLLSLAGAINFPTLFTGSDGTGLTSFLILILTVLVLSVVGFLLAKGVRTLKKPFEAFIATYIGSVFLGGIIALFALLNIPTVHVNLNWLGTNWYSPLLALLLIGTSLMLVFLASD